MKFLIDVNVSRSLGNQLIEKDYDVAFVGEVDPRMADEKILEWAVREQKIIITTDNDFEQMIWQQQKSHCGILRLENLPRKEREVLFGYALKSHGKDLQAGKIVIALQNKFQIRDNF